MGDDHSTFLSAWRLSRHGFYTVHQIMERLKTIPFIHSPGQFMKKDKVKSESSWLENGLRSCEKVAWVIPILRRQLADRKDNLILLKFLELML